MKRTIRLSRTAMARYRLLKQLKKLLKAVALTYVPLDDDQLDLDSRKARKIVYDKTCYAIDDYRALGVETHQVRGSL